MIWYNIIWYNIISYTIICYNNYDINLISYYVTLYYVRLEYLEGPRGRMSVASGLMRVLTGLEDAEEKANILDKPNNNKQQHIKLQYN